MSYCFPARKFTSQDRDIDAVFDVRTIFQQGHREPDFEPMSAFLKPGKGRYGLIDYEKLFCPDLKNGQDIFDERGINREQGCLVIVRPDQYIAQVLPLDAHQALADFFAGFMSPQS